jgi:gas vesicle protein
MYNNKKNTYMNSGSKLLLGALAGAAAGVFVAGFFTEEGEQVRKKVVKGSKDLTSNLSDKLGELKDTVTDTVAGSYQTVKQVATDFVGHGVDKASTVASNVNKK